GLVFVRAGYEDADSIAALVVAAIVLAVAVRLARGNVDVLMDRVPTDAEEAARAAIAGLEPKGGLRRPRMRQAGGPRLGDVLVAVTQEAVVGQGHAAADAVERALESTLPEADVVVHVEPAAPTGPVRERAHAAALGVPRVREVHNVSVLEVGAENQLSLHLKLPGDLSREAAQETAEEVERAIRDAVPEVSSVQTHLEPLAEEGPGTPPRADDIATDRATVDRIVRDATGTEPEELRFLHTDEGL